MNESQEWICWFEELTAGDVARVGGKNASLGEMIRTLKEKGVRVPGGFATTAAAYRRFLAVNQLEDKIRGELDAYHQGQQPLHQAGENIRGLFNSAEFPQEIAESIRSAYRELSGRNQVGALDVAVRSSATAEDLPEASFAGQQESFLNITGEDDLLTACRRCYASLFTDRAIVYRDNNGFEHMKVALSVGVQKMVRADRAGAGVMFSIDTETGFPDLAIINAAWGVGENVVQGKVNPDEYQVYKPFLDRDELQPIVEKKLGSKEQKMIYAQGESEPTKNVATAPEERNAFVLNDGEILQLARWAVIIEEHYGQPMDMEWAKDGEEGELFIVQARPETVQSQKEASVLKAFTLKEKGNLLVSGLAIGDAIAAGKAQIIPSAADIDRFEEGRILVTGMTDPDWVPAMKKAVGIVTDQGGRTSHAAIVSRELGIPAVVGCGNATELLDDGSEITLSCAEGERGNIYQGKLAFEAREIQLEEIPETKTQIMMNIANPAAAFRWWRLPVHGVGLARIEFIINNAIKIHPMALVHFDALTDEATRQEIAALTRGFEKTDYFVEHLARGIARIAAAQYPDAVVVRMSDFKSNEYAGLIGGKQFEPQEENPMLGLRGASRYYSEDYREGFALECRALKMVREEIGFKNVIIMIPFCRTVQEADRVLEVMAENGLRRGENDLQIYVMAEIPANVILAEQFAQRFDGFSIGSNDLTQLTLGVDRDEEELSELFDERDEAVRTLVKMLIEKAHQAGRKVGICGEAPSNYPEFAAFLVEEGIDSISLNPDSIIQVKQRISEVERGMRHEG